MQDKFSDMQTFVAVVKAKGIGAAATRMGMAKSGVSRRIRELEERLGVQLINRTTRTFRLTQSGADYYERCLQIMEAVQEAEDAAAGKGEEVAPSGLVRVTSPMTLGTMHIIGLMTRFATIHSRIKLDVHLTDRHVNVVEEGFDLAIRVTKLDDSTLVARHLTDVHSVAVASPGYLKKYGTPKRPEELKRHSGLLYTNVEPGRYWRFRDPKTGGSLSVEVPTVFRSNNGEALRDFAVAGHGIALIPTFIAYQAILENRLKPILTEFERPPVGMYALYPQGRYLPARTRALVEYLVEACAGTRPYWDKGIAPRRREKA